MGADAPSHDGSPRAVFRSSAPIRSRRDRYFAGHILAALQVDLWSDADASIPGT